MANATGWFMCRVGFVETTRAVALAAGEKAAKAVREEWPDFAVIEVDQDLAEHAAELALRCELRSLDALHLAAALVLRLDDLAMVTWDRRLHAAASSQGLQVLPESLEGATGG
jgi:uncharacterized protein